MDDIERTVEELRENGVEVLAPPAKVGGNTSVWTRPESSDGYQFQFLQKGASA